MVGKSKHLYDSDTSCHGNQVNIYRCRSSDHLVDSLHCSDRVCFHREPFVIHIWNLKQRDKNIYMYIYKSDMIKQLYVT